MNAVDVTGSELEATSAKEKEGLSNLKDFIVILYLHFDLLTKNIKKSPCSENSAKQKRIQKARNLFTIVVFHAALVEYVPG